MKTTKSVRAKSFNSKLAAYSATATAALLAAPTAADATIQNIATGGSFTFNYTGSGFQTQSFDAGIGHSLYFWGRKSFSNRFNMIGIGAKAGGEDFILATRNLSSAYVNLRRLSFSASVKPNSPFVQGGGNNSHVNAPIAFSQSLGGNYSFGKFKPAGSHTPATGYIGFKHVNGTQAYYGWLRISVSENANHQPLSISLVAKAGDPDVFGAFGAATDDIKAGEVAPVPEPSVAALGGLSLLALGAQGVRELRRRKTED